MTGEIPSQRASKAENFPFDVVIIHKQNGLHIRDDALLTFLLGIQRAPADYIYKGPIIRSIDYSLFVSFFSQINVCIGNVFFFSLMYQRLRQHYDRMFTCAADPNVRYET